MVQIIAARSVVGGRAFKGPAATVLAAEPEDSENQGGEPAGESGGLDAALLLQSSHFRLSLQVWEWS